MENSKFEWLEDYERIRRNPIFFIEKYYNILFPDKKLELTDEERQKLFDRYKMTPYFADMSDALKYFDKIKELKKEGYKDWEII